MEEEKREGSSKDLRKILEKRWKERGNKIGENSLDSKKIMKKASSSFKSIMEIRSILVSVYNKLLQKSGK